MLQRFIVLQRSNVALNIYNIFYKLIYYKNRCCNRYKKTVKPFEALSVTKKDCAKTVAVGNAVLAYLNYSKDFVKKL